MAPILTLKADTAQQAIEQGVAVIDVRPCHSFAAAHIPGAYSISKYGNLTTFTGGEY